MLAAGEVVRIAGGVLVVGKAMEIGHIFKLAINIRSRWREPLLDKDGKEVTRLWAARHRASRDSDGGD